MLVKWTSDSPLLLYGHVLLFGNHLPRLPMNHLSHSLLMFVNSGISTYTEIYFLVTEKNKKMNPSLNREIGKGLKIPSFLNLQGYFGINLACFSERLNPFLNLPLLCTCLRPPVSRGTGPTGGGALVACLRFNKYLGFLGFHGYSLMTRVNMSVRARLVR